MKRASHGGFLQTAGVFLMMATAGHALEPSHVRVLNEAIQLYDDASQIATKNPRRAQRLYRESAEKFQSLVNAGIRNAKLYYNLGNVHLRLGNIGQSILNYRRARRLDVSDPWLNKNLAFARRLRRTQIEAAGQSKLARFAFAWHYNTNLSTRTWLAAGAYVLVWLSLTLGTVLGRRGWKVTGCTLAGVCLALVISVSVDRHARATIQEGVLIQDDVVVRKGNGEGFEPQFVEPLHQGAEFVLVEERGRWYHIRLPGGQQGWVPASTAALI